MCAVYLHTNFVYFYLGGYINLIEISPIQVIFTKHTSDNNRFSQPFALHLSSTWNIQLDCEMPQSHQNAGINISPFTNG